MKTIEDFNLKGKKVIIRCDFNVPISKGKILDDTKIRKSLKTINYATKQGAKVILLSHLGRVNNKNDQKKYTLKPIAERLSELLKKEVLFISQTTGAKVTNAVSRMKNKQIILLENTRFEDLDKEKESQNNKALAKKWASLGDIFINDAFGCIHRAHASNVGICDYLPSGIGLLVKEELGNLKKITKNIKKPYTVILGGAKVSDKIGMINTLAEKADYLLIGGQMAFTFLKAAGFNVGLSPVQNDSLAYCIDMLNKYESKIILPIDIVTESDDTNIRFINEIKDDEIGYDIGPESIKVFKQYIEDSKTIFWNGPVGYYENEKYENGTKKLLEIISNTKCISVVGGGDMASAAAYFSCKTKLTHVSTGGGATLKLIEGKTLPALKAIDEK